MALMARIVQPKASSLEREVCSTWRRLELIAAHAAAMTSSENHVLCLCSAGPVFAFLGWVGLGWWAGLGNEVATMLQQMNLTSGSDQGDDV